MLIKLKDRVLVSSCNGLDSIGLLHTNINILYCVIESKAVKLDKDHTVILVTSRIVILSHTKRVIWLHLSEKVHFVKRLNSAWNKILITHSKSSNFRLLAK